MDGILQNSNLKRFQVYKKVNNGRLMHITSLLASSLKDAINKANDTKTNGGGNGYYVTGLVKNTGNDIYSNLPFHCTRRINNHGNKVKYRGKLYDNHNKTNF